MYSLNVPLPGAALRRIESLRPALGGFETVRDQPTLLVKRFDRTGPDEAAHLEYRVREAVADTRPFEVTLDGIDAFVEPVVGTAPVAYLAVESPGLERLHRQLVDVFGAASGLEGDDYVPHVTLARGGDRAALERLETVEVEPTRWTVRELWFWDGSRGERTGRLTLD